jgi:hypothetical protein
MEACVPIIRKEIIELGRMGVDAVQLDEPWLASVPDPEYCREEGITDIEEELEHYVTAVNACTEGIKGPSLSLRVCGHHSPTSPNSSDCSYDVRGRSALAGEVWATPIIVIARLRPTEGNGGMSVMAAGASAGLCAA